MAYEYDYLKDFTGGENSASSPDELLPNQLLICENIDLSTRGGFNRRKGISLHKTVGMNRIDRLIEFEYLNGGNPILKTLVLTGGELIDTATDAVLKSGLDADLDYTIYKDEMYFLSNGQYLVYDGVTVEIVTSTNPNCNLPTIRKCRYIEQRGQRLFASGNPEDPTALYFSDVGVPNHWDITSIVQVITNDGDKVTGLKEYHGQLVVFKSRAIYTWSGYDPMADVEFKRLNVHTGTRAHRTVQRVNNSLFYLGYDGVYALDGTYENVIVSRKISKNINDRMKDIKHNDTFYMDASCAVFHEGKYMLSVPTADTISNNVVFVLYTDVMDEATQPWGVYTGWYISDFLVSLDGELYSANSIEGKVHRHDDIYHDMGAGIAVKVRLRPLSQEAFVHNKKYRKGYIVMRQYVDIRTTVTIKSIVDYREEDATVSPDESLVWDDRDWGLFWGFTDLVTRKFDIRERGKRLIIELTDNTADQALTVYGFAIEYKYKKPDRR
jgi:hypothetical protein